MARKRMIDPSIWTDEGMAELTPIEQLLYIGLFSIADDDGRLKASPTYLRLALPTILGDVDKGEIPEMVAKIARHMTKLQLYTVDGSPYLAFRNYRTWQRIDKPSDSRLPAPPDEIDRPPFDERSTNDLRMIDERSSLIEKNRSKENIGAPPKATRPRVDYTDEFEDWWLLYPKRGDTKSTAFAAWRKLRDEHKALARDGLRKWLPYYATLENRLIPDASTWLNQRRWENDPPPSNVTPIKPTEITYAPNF